MSETLKPVRCGCGGEARTGTIYGDAWTVECTECGIQSGCYDTEAEAIKAWNRAMDKKTAKVIDRRYNGTALGILGLADSSYGTCENCWGDVLDRYTYCPHCGVRLEWK